jgi:tryptophan synthase beta chain
MYIPSPSKFDPVEGHFGIFGGRYVPETLMPALLELEAAYKEIRFDESISGAKWTVICTDYVGRPSPLYYASQTSLKSWEPKSISSEKI